MRKILSKLQSGNQFFSKDEFDNYDDFLNVINELEELERKGIIEIIEKHRESFSGEHGYDFFQCKITDYGMEFLDSN